MPTVEPSPLTVPLSWIYRALSGFYHGAFDRGFRKPQRLGAPVLSVGNLVVGGTGKTPVVLALTGAALDRGWRPAILTRGYGGSRTGLLRDGAWGSGEAGSAGEAGDEPLLLSRELPGVTVGVGPDRARSAVEILRREPVDLFLLDDGFQHRRVFREADLLLLDAEEPFGNGRLLPAGSLREPIAAARRAHAILLTGLPADAPVPESTLRTLRDLIPRCPVWPTRLVLQGFRGVGDASARPAPEGPLFLVAGIARPERFQRFLETRGFQVAGRRWFRDHHPYSRDEAAELEREAARTGAALVTTAKDATRLEGRCDPAASWRVARLGIEMDGGWSALLERLLPEPVSGPAKKERSGRRAAPRDRS
jgi:tetraacyldisaccharide 4'-kinase